MSRVYNFSAGPAVLPEAVLKQCAADMLDYKGSGMSVMEMSHRGKVYDAIIKEAEQDLRDLMGIPDDYAVMFLQGGASTQFAMIPMNLMKNHKAAFIVTGQWAKKACAEASKYGEAVVVASSADKTFSYLPDCTDLPIPEDADYVYICENNTIYGTEYKTLPNTKGHILVADISSNFLSRPVDVTKYGLLYGGVQKNVGPAGVTIVIMRKDLIPDELPEQVELQLVAGAIVPMLPLLHLSGILHPLQRSVMLAIVLVGRTTDHPHKTPIDGMAEIEVQTVEVVVQVFTGDEVGVFERIIGQFDVRKPIF